MRRIAICGHGRHGKDTAAQWFADHTPLRFAGSLSWFLAKDVAKHLGCSREQAFLRRHESDDMRMLWYRIGNETRQHDPGYLVRQALAEGDIVCGLRDAEEAALIVDEGLVDMMIWIERPGLPDDPTMMFGPEMCDIVIRNDGSLEAFYRKLSRFACFSQLCCKEVGDD